MNHIHLPDETKNKILNLLAAKPEQTYADVATELNVSKALVQKVDVESIYLGANELMFGREDLNKYTVAIRDGRLTTTWDNESPRIKRARELYDAGYVELTTRRHNDFFILYAMPKKYREKRSMKYFEITDEFGVVKKPKLELVEKENQTAEKENESE